MSKPAPGWYPNPSNPLEQRLWDGEGWTQQTRQAPPVITSPTPPPVASPSRPQTGPPPRLGSASNFFVSHKVLTAIGVLLIGSLIGGIAASSGGKASSAHIGLGSTISEMSSAHGVARGPGDICTATNSCFGTPLKNAESGNTYQFTNAMTGGGLIIEYQQNFVRGTTATSAVAQVLQNLPADSVAGPIVVGHTGANSCGLLNITSQSLGSTLTKAGQTAGMGHPADEVGVVLEYTNSNLNTVYDPNNVEDAIVSPVSVTTTGTPGC